ncbi:hypothetical protein H5410_040378 [Solanum commersonii]|uniref:Uncharacterized protein n=1 Tax=Solanum commersonii TaxID=4109 RepID=A0A9J5XRV4_SOLCO|nr:hypothetical protein H5410_040378 [Solanum commersonii]
MPTRTYLSLRLLKPEAATTLLKAVLHLSPTRTSLRYAPCTSATPRDMICALAHGGRNQERLGRVMIKRDGSSDATEALKECVRRLYTQAYHLLRRDSK